MTNNTAPRGDELWAALDKLAFKTPAQTIAGNKGYWVNVDDIQESIQVIRKHLASAQPAVAVSAEAAEVARECVEAIWRKKTPEEAIDYLTHVFNMRSCKVCGRLHGEKGKTCDACDGMKGE